MVLPHLLFWVALMAKAKSTLSLQLGTGLLSRQDFLLASVALPAGLQSPIPQSTTTANDKKDGILEIPLTFLPRGGCLAVKVSLNDRAYNERLFGYYAIIDTGSPFITAPPEITRFSKDESHRYPPTREQYGETTGIMPWISVFHVEILTNKYESPLTLSKMIVGLPERNVVDDTGGIFLGLIWQDDNRPSFLRQCGYHSFILDYRLKLLTLSRRSLTGESDPDALQLFDFSPYGTDINHYGVQCKSFTLLFDNKRRRITMSSLKRPVIAVIDSGLTGCVFSDSLRDELIDGGGIATTTTRTRSLKQVTGLQVTLPTLGGSFLTLTSNPDYWLLSIFKLPWFEDDATHPHVIAMGATFLSNNSRISMDPLAGKAKIEI